MKHFDYNAMANAAHKKDKEVMDGGPGSGPKHGETGKKPEIDEFSKAQAKRLAKIFSKMKPNSGGIMLRNMTGLGLGKEKK